MTCWTKTSIKMSKTVQKTTRKQEKNNTNVTIMVAHPSTINYLVWNRRRAPLIKHLCLPVFVTFVSFVASLPPDQHGVITTEEDQYLIEPLKNISSTTSSEWNLDEAQQHVIYKMSAIPSPQEHSQEFSCGISGWWTSIWVWTLCGWNWRKGITIHSRLEEVLVWF